MTEPGQPELQPLIHITPEGMSGVYANYARVGHSPYEFTLDFCRLDFTSGGPPFEGIVVARVSLSPLLVSQLIDALGTNWTNYAETQMPPEVRNEHGDTPRDEPDDGASDPSA